MVNLFPKKYFSFFLNNVADMANRMSNFDNFDIDRISSKFAQR